MKPLLEILDLPNEPNTTEGLMKKQENRGGKRPNSGRKKAADKKKPYPAYLYTWEHEQLLAKYGSISNALKSLILPNE